MTINDLADYIIWKSSDQPSQPLNLLKLQKLAYYSQAWHLAIRGTPMAPGAKFEAWVHGPVSRDLYNRFASSKLFETVTMENFTSGFDPNRLSTDEREIVDAVMEEYGKFSGSQLEELTHREDPWRKARGALAPTEASRAVIDEGVMRTYYAARLQPAS